MDGLAGAINKSQTKAKVDSELGKAMLEGTQQFRKKLKLPEPGEHGNKAKDDMCESSFFNFWEDKIGKYYFCRFLQDVQSAHGINVLQCLQYRASVHISKKEEIAHEMCSHFVGAVGEIWSSADTDQLIEAFEEGKKIDPKGKKSVRQNNKANKVKEAQAIVDKVQRKLDKLKADREANPNKGRPPPDLLDEMTELLTADLSDYWPAFKKSKYMDLYARAREMEKLTVDQDDFHQFRVLGVGGFGAVHAAVKKDTGMLCAIKRMDKKLIKHKNRYKSCYTEVECLKQMSSPFVCGMHYTFQTKDDVCLVLDLLHGGTLSYLLHTKKKIDEKLVCFFTACICFAYEALHSKGFVYRDMKPANVLIKDNGYAVLIDFGLAAKLDTALKGKCGTRGYWAPEMVKGNQYLTSGDWWSLGVTLVELLTGKKPFKKKFQKQKNTDDKVCLCKAGNIEDDIEERNIEQKLGKAKEEEDDGRDSNDEETDDESADEAEKVKDKRRSSVRVIGGFDKMVPSMVETEAALELMEKAINANEKLAVFKSDNQELEGGMERLIKIMSLVSYDGETEVFMEGEFATFFCIVLDGSLSVSGSSTMYNEGDVVGWEGLFEANYNRPATVKSGRMGGTLGVFLYSELGRAVLYDEPVMAALKTVLAASKGGGEGDATTLDEAITTFGEAEDTHPEERFIAHQKHAKKKEDHAAVAEKQKEMNEGKKRDFKIYLTQEVWCKKSYVSKRETQKFVQGLLTRDVNKRLGCSPTNPVREHEFFTEAGPLKGGINWDRLEDQSTTAPFIPKAGEVHAKDESKMKTFNTAGMKKLTKEDEEKWAEWDWNSAEYFQDEMSCYLYEQWGLHEKGSRFGLGGGGGGCCTLS